VARRPCDVAALGLLLLLLLLRGSGSKFACDLLVVRGRGGCCMSILHIALCGWCAFQSQDGNGDYGDG